MFKYDIIGEMLKRQSSKREILKCHFFVSFPRLCKTRKWSNDTVETGKYFYDATESGKCCNGTVETEAWLKTQWKQWNIKTTKIRNYWNYNLM